MKMFESLYYPATPIWSSANCVFSDLPSDSHHEFRYRMSSYIHTENDPYGHDACLCALCHNGTTILTVDSPMVP